MSQKNPKQSPSRTPQPEIEPIPGDVPKKFPNTPEPLSTKSPEYSPSESREASAEATSGEDPLVESGVPDNDPEQPRETDEDQSNR